MSGLRRLIGKDVIVYTTVQDTGVINIGEDQIPIQSPIKYLGNIISETELFIILDDDTHINKNFIVSIELHDPNKELLENAKESSIN